MSSRSCPDWPTADGARARGPVQALHPRRRAAQLPADALVGRSKLPSTSTRSRSAAISRWRTCSNVEHTDQRRSSTRSAPRTGSTCARWAGRAHGPPLADAAATGAAWPNGPPHPGGSVQRRCRLSSFPSAAPKGSQEQARCRSDHAGIRIDVLECARDARRRARGSARRSAQTLVRRRARAELAAGDGAAIVARSSASRAGRRGARAALDVAALADTRRAGWGRSWSSTPTFPCATARDLLALAGAVPDGGWAYAVRAQRRTARRMRSGSPRPGSFAPVYGARAAPRGSSRRSARRIASTRRTSIDDVDTLADLERLVDRRLGPHARATRRSPRLRRARRGRMNVTVLSGGVGGAPVPAGAGRGVVNLEQRQRHRQRRRRHRGARPPRLARSRQHPLRARRASPMPRSAAGAGPARPGDALEAVASQLGGREPGFSARRSRPRPAPRAHGAPPRGQDPLSEVTEHASSMPWVSRLRFAAASLPADRRSAAHLRRDASPGTFPFQ